MIKKLIRKIVLFVTPFVILGVAYFFWPRQARLRDFEPAQAAELETAMWRQYYDHDYSALFRTLYELNRKEYHFSPFDSVRVAYYAAKAAKVFQPTRSRAEAQEALPWLEKYYGLIQSSSGEPFNAGKVARLELDWWQLRRENAKPEQYGDVIAMASVEIYGVTNNAIKQAGILRAEMMRYRDDRRDGKMQPEDWTHIDEGLTRSYTLLKQGIDIGDKRTR